MKNLKKLTTHTFKQKPQKDSNTVSILKTIEQSFSVQYQYSVHFTRNLFDLNNTILSSIISKQHLKQDQNNAVKILIFVEQTLREKHPELITSIQGYMKKYNKIFALRDKPILLPGGEHAKNDSVLIHRSLQQIHKHKICRHSYIMAIGGGAFLDLLGYVTGIAHRGIRLIRVPTTVLSQNDSGIGVKTSVNYFGKKNFLGTFTPPNIVINDSVFLTTLDDRNWRAGVAESVKVALLKDRDFFLTIASQTQEILERNLSTMEYIIHRCAELHIEHIGQYGDPFERGSSRPLDFGHWAAHKLEQLTEYRLLHGEAVAIGIALDITYSFLAGFLRKQTWKQIIATLQALEFKLFVPELANFLNEPNNPNSIFSGLKEFQEHIGGQLTILLLKDIGQGFDTNQIDIEQVKKAILMLQSL